MPFADVPERSMPDAESIEVEVAYALPERQTLLRLRVPLGTRLGEAIHLSGLLERHPEIDLTRQAVGIFSRAATLDTPLHPGDRVEIYRPLVADPKQARKRKAESAKSVD